MCNICGNNLVRNYTHSRSKIHLKKLIAILKERKETGYYKKIVIKEKI